MAWRDHLKVHPACECAPQMSKERLRDLGEDIKVNRMRERIKLLHDGAAYILLDGRSRLDAHEDVGFPIQIFDEGGKPNNRFFEVVDLQSLGVSAEAYVASMNLHRRHLTAEDRAQFLDRLIKLHPEKSDRQLAREAGVDHKTAGAHREKLEGRGEAPHVENRVNSHGQEYNATRPKIQRRPADIAAQLRMLGDDILPDLVDDTLFARLLQKKNPLAKYNLPALTVAWTKLPFEKQEVVAEIAINRYERAWRALERVLDKGTMRVAKAGAKAKGAPASLPAKDAPPLQASQPTQPANGSPQPAVETGVQQHLALVRSTLEIIELAVRVRRSTQMREVVELCDWISKYGPRVHEAGW
jgi:hypothetical protein